MTSAQTRPAHRRRRRLGRGTLNVIGVLLALLWVFPVYWMVNTALTPRQNLFGLTPSLFPAPATLENFTGILSDRSFWRAMRTSALLTGLVLVASVIMGFLAAVAVSRFRFRARGLVVLTVVVIQMIPAEALFISQFRMLDDWNLLNSVPGLSVLYLAGIVPFTAWLMRGFIDQIPADLEEAAMVDGCSRVGAFFRVTLPLLGPGLVTAGVFSFLHAWNEYGLALVVMTKPEQRTLPLWLQTFGGGDLKAADWGGLMAGATLIALPVVVLFMLVQTRMSSGMVAGAVKG